MILLATILNAIGFFALAMADLRYRDALLGRGRRIARPRRVKAAGAVLITASGASLLLAAGFASAIVTFAGLSTVGAVISVLCITTGRHLRSR